MLPERGEIEYERFCAICGTCFCPPDETTLATYIPDRGLLDSITEDDVAWLGRFKIIGLSSSGTAFVTGPCRERCNRAEITRGSASDISFGKIINRKGGGPEEVLSVEYLARENFWTNRNISRAKAWLKVHVNCFDVVFLRALDYTNQRDGGFFRYGGPLYDAIVEHSRMLLPRECLSVCAQRRLGYGRLRSDDEAAHRLKLISMRKVGQTS